MSSNCREEYYDPISKVAVTIVDAQSAAETLIANHLSGPAAGYFLSEGLAAVALLGAEMSEPEECVSLQLKCKGPLGGMNVECTSGGTLRGYTEKKILDDFDDLEKFDQKKIMGEKQIQVTRTVPGRIISQGIATNLTGYLNQSLQRNAVIKLEGYRGILVEALPDSEIKDLAPRLREIKSLNVASRNILKKLGFMKAELKKSTELKFACRCSKERAKEMAAALGEKGKLDIVCHMCGKLYTVVI